MKGVSFTAGQWSWEFIRYIQILYTMSRRFFLLLYDACTVYTCIFYINKLCSSTHTFDIWLYFCACFCIYRPMLSSRPPSVGKKNANHSAYHSMCNLYMLYAKTIHIYLANLHVTDCAALK